jgi:hypothetical protein
MKDIVIVMTTAVNRVDDNFNGRIRSVVENCEIVMKKDGGVFEA